jgi:N-acetylglucosaminyl-diphospho-decaprenol L-rhamnosyltransferase
MPRLAIIIVTFNSRREIDGCLKALARRRPAVAHDIIVVDNASSDETAAHVRLTWPAVRVIDAGTNLGFAAANNVGIRQTAGELVLLLNPDASVADGAIDRLVAALDASPGAAVAGPRVVNADGHAELSFGRMISPLAELRQKVLVAGADRRLPLIGGWVDRATRRRQSVDWVSGVCLLIRRADLEGAGLLDERFFMYVEDVDLCAAVRARGRLVLFEPAAEIVHLRGRSAASARSATHLAYRRSHVAFYEKHHPRWAPVLRAYLRWKGEDVGRTKEKAARSKEEEGRRKKEKRPK